MAAYDEQNIFARILRGEIPSHIVHETPGTLAFMDVMPRSDGHCLVLPKAPVRTLLDASPADLASLFAAVQVVARAAQAAMGAEGLTLHQFNEVAGGQSVFHMHVHVLPRWTGVPLRPHGGAMADPEILAGHAARIRAALGG